MPSLFPYALNGDLYNNALTSVMRQQWRIPDPSFALATDPEIYDKMLREPIIAHGCNQRAHMVGGKEWTFEPGGPALADLKLAQILQSLLSLCPRIETARFRQAFAFFYGSTYEEMRGDFEYVHLDKDDRTRRWWVLQEFKNADRRRFGKFNDDGVGNPPRWKMWHTLNGWLPLDEETARYYVKHVYNDVESTLGHGRGLVDALYWTFYAIGVARNEGLAGLERWAQGWVTAKVADMRKGSTDRDNDSVVARWLEKIDAMRGRHALVYGGDDVLEVKETSGAGHQIVIDFLNHLYTDVTRLILGSLRPTGGGGEGATGARAQADVEMDATYAVIGFDTAALDGTWSSDVGGLLIHMNRPILREMGLHNARPPRFVTVREKVESRTENATVIKTALDAGMELPQAWAYEQIGAPVPKPGEPTVKGRPAPTPMPGMPL